MTESVSGGPKPSVFRRKPELNSLFNQRMPSGRARPDAVEKFVRCGCGPGGPRPAFNRRWPPRAAGPVLADEFTSLPAAHVPSSAADRIDSFITSYAGPAGRRSRVVRCFNIYLPRRRRRYAVCLR